MYLVDIVGRWWDVKIYEVVCWGSGLVFDDVYKVRVFLLDEW